MADVYVSTNVLPGRTVAQVLEVAGRWGIRHIELSSGLAHHPDMISVLEGAQGRFHFLVHNYFPPPKKSFLLNLASGSSDIRGRSLMLCKEAIDLCARVGSPFYSVHCGFAFDGDGDLLGNAGQLDRPRIDLTEALSHFFASLDQLIAHAGKNGVGLIIENNALASFALIDNTNLICLGADIQGLDDIFNRYDPMDLGLLLDIGHAKVSGNSLGFAVSDMVERFADRIVAIHVSDNNGIDDQNRPIRPDSDLLPLIKKLPMPRVLETCGLERDDLLEQIRLLKSQ